MRIAHVLASFGVGGGEMVALNLAQHQLQQGHQVHAVSLAPPPEEAMADRFRRAGAQVHTVAKRPGFDLTLYPRLGAFFLRQHLEVVHTHNPQSLIYAALPARLTGATVIHTKHGEAADLGRRLWLRRWAATFLHAFVSVSQQTEQYARKNREAPRRLMTVIDNGIDLSRFRPDPAGRAAVRRELGLDDQAWLLGTVGRLDPVKDQRLLIVALAPLLGPTVHLALVGEGPSRGALEEEAERCACRRFVHFLGLRDDVPQVMAALDLFLLSSRTEGLPMVLIEAMASGLAVVSTAVGGIPEVVEAGHTGLLVPAGEAPALRWAVEGMLRERPRCQTMGKKGNMLARSRYSLDEMARRYMALYRRKK